MVTITCWEPRMGVRLSVMVPYLSQMCSEPRHEQACEGGAPLRRPSAAGPAASCWLGCFPSFGDIAACAPGYAGTQLLLCFTIWKLMGI